MPIDALKLIRLKIERARQHIVNLGHEIENYRQTKPYSLEPSIDPTTGNEIVHINLPEAVPPGLSIIVGDVLHNLRSALDQLACRLAELSGASNTDDVYFPFGKSREAFEASAKRKIKKMNPASQAFIYDLKPYCGGDDLLWSIHFLNIVDKHRLLVPISSLGIIQGVPVGDPLYELMLPDFDAIEERMTEVPLRQTPIFQYEIQFTFDIGFRDTAAVKDKSVLVTLNQMSDLVTGILNQAERQFF